MLTGEAIGTLCVLGTKQTRLSDEQKRCLSLIAQLIVSEIERQDWIGADGQLIMDRVPLLVSSRKLKSRGLIISERKIITERLSGHLIDVDLEQSSSAFKGCAYFERAIKIESRTYSIVFIDAHVAGLSWRQIVERIRRVGERVLLSVVHDDSVFGASDDSILYLSLDAEDAEWQRNLQNYLDASAVRFKD